MNTVQQKAQKLAEEVLIYSRNTLLVNMRFLDVALSQLEMVPCDGYGIMTDGKSLLYDPKKVLQDFKLKKEISVRTYLHIIMHCVYRHMFISPSLERPLWDLACDIAVENAISKLGLKFCDSGVEQHQESHIKKIEPKASGLTAEKIYYHLKSIAIDEKICAEIRKCFFADNHDIWYMTDDQKNDENNDTNENGDNESNNGDNESYYSEKMLIAEEWQKISERIQIDIETFEQERGLNAGDMLQNLKEVNREKYDYEAFLKKFATMGEIMKINDDEFDYNFYTYGLKLYEKMPLIEPLEYKDVKRIREFVIAIDTSGSTSGELVQTFLQKTYNILKSTESFFSKINLHIIQCDADIQEDVKLENQADFDHYLKKMKILGHGGTDFRPVFQHVDNLRRNKEFTNLKGLIYFTDGFGDFPSKKPDYETAFVFVDDEDNNLDVPPWAIKLVLRKNEI